MDKKPVYFYEKLSKHFKYRTRLASTNGVRINAKVTKELSHQNFLYRFSQHWNELPIDLRQTQDIRTFKKNLKNWVLSNVPVK